MLRSNCTGFSRGCLELSPETSCDSSPSHALCCLIWDPTQPAQTQRCQPYTTHHYLDLVASIDSDFLDKIVILRSTRICNLRSLPAVRIIIEINGVVVYTSTDVDSCSSRHFSVGHDHVNHLLWSFSSVLRLLTSLRQTRTSRFDLISTSCVALRLEVTQLQRTLCTPIVWWTCTPNVSSLPMLDNLMTT